MYICHSNGLFRTPYTLKPLISEGEIKNLNHLNGLQFFQTQYILLSFHNFLR